MIGLAMKRKQKRMLVHDRRTTDLLINAVTANVVVPDPYSDHGELLLVTRSLRDDPLASMLSHKQIDQAQYDAGRIYERCAELAEIGGASAIDPTKEPVDGGRMREPITDTQIKAVRKLGEASSALGMVGEALTRDILVRRYSFRQVGAIRQMVSERDINRLRHRFTECLETLAKLWGCAV